MEKEKREYLIEIALRVNNDINLCLFDINYKNNIIVYILIFNNSK